MYCGVACIGTKNDSEVHCVTAAAVNIELRANRRRFQGRLVVEGLGFRSVWMGNADPQAGEVEASRATEGVVILAYSVQEML